MEQPAQRIADLVTPTIEGLGFELVRVQVSGARHPIVQLMVERAGGAAPTVEECARVSRQVSAVLDVADPLPDAYTLEVSSPGIDRPLTRPKDFARWTGHEARVELATPVAGRRRFKGTLLGLEGEDGDPHVRLRDEEAAEHRLPLAAVQRAKLILTDALIAASAPTPVATPDATPADGPGNRPN